VPGAFQYLSRKIIIIPLNLILAQKPIGLLAHSPFLKIELKLLVVPAAPMTDMKISIEQPSHKIPRTPGTRNTELVKNTFILIQLTKFTLQGLVHRNHIQGHFWVPHIPDLDILKITRENILAIFAIRHI
jgi:hypothetical protein